MNNKRKLTFRIIVLQIAIQMHSANHPHGDHYQREKKQANIKVNQETTKQMNKAKQN